MPIRHYRKEELEYQLNRGSQWAITYGDLMSYLMIFFLVLFSFGLAKEEKEHKMHYDESLARIQEVFGGEEDAQRKMRRVQKEMEEGMATRLKQSMVPEKMKDLLDVQSSEERIRLVLSVPVLFDLGSVQMKKAAFPILNSIAQELAKLPNDIVIEGHTDNVRVVGGRYASNWELSMARAYSIIRFFEKAGIDSKRLSGIGYGENRPVANNNTEEGRTRNRRIEVSLIRQ
ncbi:MAG: OmpA family protein [Elusimicrobia bacterium]|nr:OmpA family protein [Elusimicrobiota bacterium]